MNGKFISYLRVSTQKQGASGLGIEAQRAAVTAFLNGGDWELLREYPETESGKSNERPELAKALAHCRITGATLVVAKIDRLARNARFLLSIVEGSGDGGVVFCDLPSLPAGPVGKFMLTQMAAVAELEAGLISQRTRAALSAARERGVRLGGWRGGPVVDHRKATDVRKRQADDFARRVAPMVLEMRGRGLKLAEIARALTDQGIQTPRGGTWTSTGVRNLLARAA